MDIIDELARVDDPIAQEAADELRAYRSTVYVLTREIEALRNKREQHKPVGPLGKIELKECLKILICAIYECDTEQEVDDVLEDSKILLRQAEVDAPEWLTGGVDNPAGGIYARAERVRELCRPAN